ncbi:MAG: transcriptional repressor [Candidatus Saccharibacteria bacterium]
MTVKNPTLERHLQAHHLHVTKVRQLVYQVLQDHEPQTMQQLVGHCQNRIDRASVYRTVRLFEHLAIIQRLQIGWKYKLELSNAFQDHHHHLTCLQCGRVTPLPEDHLLETQLTRLARYHDFDARDHQLEIRGLCSNCR